MNSPDFNPDKIQGIFFDVYGTLFIYNNMEDAWKDWITTYHRLLHAKGLQMPLETFISKTDGFFSLPEPTDKEKDFSVFQCRVKRYVEELGLELSNEIIKEISDKCLNEWQKYVLLDPEVIPLLAYLKQNKKLALISNFDHPPHLHNLLKASKIIEYFDHITISGEIGIKKPNPEIFSSALAELNLSPGEVIYIGDSPVDVKAAQEANMTPIIIMRKNLEHYSLQTDFNKEGISRKISLPKYKDILIINSLKDLYDLF
ncbi:MAG: hypothetical protein BAJALOKI1v1_290003 [Promethearchaeota archaeon]|nr:MAG: hypothetical protein BAJALOKI1v1_290003 [Candidatus Lokiarchaeota archaeon]